MPTPYGICLLTSNNMSHHGDMLSDGKEMSPTLENCIVLTWLRLIHYDLPKLVKQRYGTELRSRTFVSIKPDISQALQSLLDEIRSADDAKVIRTAALPFKKSSSGVRQQGSTPILDPRERCKLAGRAEFRQFLNTCKYLTKNDRKCMNKARQIVGIIDDQSDDAYADCQYDSHPPVNEVDPAPNSVSSSTFRFMSVSRSTLVRFIIIVIVIVVVVVVVVVLLVDVVVVVVVIIIISIVQLIHRPHHHRRHHHVRVTVDSGATGNMIRLSTVQRLGATIRRCSQSAHQADGSSPPTVICETRLTLVRGEKSFTFDGLIIENLDVEVIAERPFMECNDIAVRPAKRQVILCDGTSLWL